MSLSIETENLTRGFGRGDVVSNLNLQVREGSIYAFLGPNGAGKTTTIKMLLNILPPSSGRARVMGIESTRMGPAEFAQIGYVSENQRLPEWMTVRQLLEYCRPMYPTWDADFCAKLLRDFGLPQDQKLRSLSRGMKVKAALVSSLAYRPRLLVFDEPFSGLDPLVRDEFIRGILELAEQDGWTIFISSHDIDEVERLADWVGVIDRGRLQLSEPTDLLQGRFRRAELSLPAAVSRLPADLPASWLLPEVAGQNVRLLESQYREGATEAELARVFPGATIERIAPMSLREIFLALAATFRFSIPTRA